MPVSKVQKTEILNGLIEGMKQAKVIVFADYQGMSVKEIKDMRSKMREKGASFQVAKKTLMSIAAREAGYESIPKEVMEGPVGVALGLDDEISAAKIISQLSKKNKNLKLRGALLEGRVLSILETKELAELPSMEELIGKFMYLIKYPIQGFHGVLNNTIAGFVRALNAIKEQKEQSA